jgi:hypothetical protein
MEFNERNRKVRMHMSTIVCGIVVYMIVDSALAAICVATCKQGYVFYAFVLSRHGFIAYSVRFMHHDACMNSCMLAGLGGHTHVFKKN